MSIPDPKVVLVTVEDERPASKGDGLCFYCKQAIGQPHTFECVAVERSVRIRMTVEYDVDVPRSWDKGAIEFHRNDGSWCANNAVDELQELRDRAERLGCICLDAKFEYLGESEPPDDSPTQTDE